MTAISALRFLACLVALSVAGAAPLLAQEDLPHAGWPNQPPPEIPMHQHPYVEGPPNRPVREGFTIELALGLGLQASSPDDGQEFDEIGLGGLDFGIGGFLTPQLGLLFKVATTSVWFSEEGTGDDIVSSSGFVGAVLQAWPIDRFKLEGGMGFGFHSYDVDRDPFSDRNDERVDAGGFGLLAGVAVPFWSNYMHGVELGLSYAPAFVEDGVVHNLAFTLGWQLY